MLNGKTTTITTLRNEDNLNLGSNDLGLSMYFEKRYFIPSVMEIEGVLVPSTPYNLNDGSPLYMADVFSLTLPANGNDKESIEYFLVGFEHGQYMGLTNNPDSNIELEVVKHYESANVRNMGNSIANPRLLNLLQY
jgi:hypothetical protein